MAYYMNYRQAFQILEIEPTTDTKKIRRAYAGLAKKYHPEEQPEEWQRIHNAYECAMNYAGPRKESNAVLPMRVALESAKPETPKQEKVRIPEQEKEESELKEIQNLIQQEKEKRKSELEKELVRALDILAELSERKIQTANQWKKTLDLSEVRKVQTNTAFLLCLRDVLGKIRISLSCYKVIKRFLGDVHEEIAESIFYSDGNRANMDALDAATEGLKQALWGKEIIGIVNKIKTASYSSKFRFGFRVVFGILMLCLWIGTVYYRVTNSGNALSGNEGVVLQIVRHENSKAVTFGQESTFPSKSVATGWRIRSMMPPESVQELAQIDDMDELVACFMIGHTQPRGDKVNVVLSLKEFGLQEGEFEIWQYDGAQYQRLEIHTYDKADNDRQTEYPFLVRNLLCIKAHVYEVGDKAEGYPIVIVQKDK